MSLRRTPPGGNNQLLAVNRSQTSMEGIGSLPLVTSTPAPVRRVMDRLNQTTPQSPTQETIPVERKRKKINVTPEDENENEDENDDVVLLDSGLKDDGGTDFAAKIGDFGKWGTVVVVKQADWETMVHSMASLNATKDALENAVHEFKTNSKQNKQLFETQLQLLHKEITDLRTEKEHMAQLRNAWSGELAVGLATFKKEGEEMKTSLAKVMSDLKKGKESTTDKTTSEVIVQDQIEEVQVMEEQRPEVKDVIDMGKRITKAELQRTTEELLIVHENLKDKLKSIQGNFKDIDLKENTQSQKEFEEFKGLRTDMTRWYLACQILKKNSCTRHFDPQPYLKVDTKYSQSATDKNAVKVIEDKLQEAGTMADSQLKMASLELNLARADKLMELAKTEDKDRQWLLAKAFKVVVNSHRSLHDRNLFQQNARPRQRPERRRFTDRRQDFPRDVPQGRGTRGYDEDFPPMKKAEELVFENDVFDTDVGPWSHGGHGREDRGRETEYYRQQDDRRPYYTEDRQTDYRPFRREGEGFNRYNNGYRDRKETEVDTDYREYLPYRA